ncbi:MAG: peptide chain release factor N(5)-glutamine methyltransferase, partial [Rhodospirillales bacterium]
AALAGRFDLIVSNPPYIDGPGFAGLDPTVRCFEPSAALCGGTDGLDAYRSLAAHLPRLLAPAGVIVVEIGVGQSEGVTGLLAGASLALVAVGRDLAGHERCLVFRQD